VLTVEQHAALVTLTRTGEMTSSQLAAELEISRTDARHLLLGLVEHGHASARRTLRGRIVYRAT
jgi:predicted ArsR family transcriptional regulator